MSAPDARTDDLLFEIKTYRSKVRIPWRVRFRVWRWYRKLTPLQREQLDTFGKALTDAFINGAPR